MADLSTQIENAAQAPKSVAVDGQSVQAVSVAEMIEADRYLKSQTGAANNHLGLRFRKLISED